MQESKIIRKGLLSLFCTENKVEIYWQDKLITSEIGLDTLFRCGEKSYRAQDGSWNIRKDNDNQISITISWNDNPGFIQIWRLILKDDNTFFWEIDMTISDKIKIRNKQVELILSQEYKKWFTQDEKGDFSRLSRQGNTVILNKYINNCMGVSCANDNGFFMPELLFNRDGSFSAASYISKIAAKEAVIKLRYLEIDRKENFYSIPGTYKYFNGELKVGLSKEIASCSIKVSTKNTAEIKYNKTSLIFYN